MNEEKVYSYHTFILPFTWRIPGVKGEREYDALKSVFDNNTHWKRCNLVDESNILSKPDIEDFKEVKQFYKEYQYFYPYVRKAIYGNEDNICANYLLETSRNNGEYHIEKDEKHYVLHINAVRVRIVNTGVALFILECENHGTDAHGKPQNDIGSIKDINDYGRRITLPFIAKEYSINADKLSVIIPGIGEFSDDFKTFIDDTCKNDLAGADHIALNNVCDFIKALMSYGSLSRFVSHPSVNKGEVQIWPALDDRMYVAFAVSDTVITDLMQQEKEGKYLYEVDDELNKSIYEIAYADNSGGCTCPDRSLRSDLINKALYNRWLPYGTAYTVSSMGFGMICSEDTGSYLFENFLTCYVQMVYLIIIQKASIVKFSRQTANIARYFAADGRKLRRGDIRRIMNLQERYAAFDSQLRLAEVSSEQQAIEIYDMLKSVFSIGKENRKLGQRLTSLYEITDTDLNIRVNTIVSILTWVSIFLSGGALVYNMLFASDVVIHEKDELLTGREFLSIDVHHWLFLFALLTLSIISLIIVRIRNRRK